MILLLRNIFNDYLIWEVSIYCGILIVYLFVEYRRLGVLMIFSFWYITLIFREKKII